MNVKANSGDIWLPLTRDGSAKAAAPTPVELHVDDAARNAADPVTEPVQAVSKPASQDTPAKADDMPKAAAPAPSTAAPAKEAPAADPAYTEAFEKGKIAGLQEAIIAIMEKNGNVTDQMRKDVTDNVYHDSLINWIKSFR